VAVKVEVHNTKAPPQGQGASPYKTKAPSVDAMYSGRTPGKHAAAEKVDKNHGGSSTFQPGTRRVVNGS
jgi:hypothetical protein